MQPRTEIYAQIDACRKELAEENAFCRDLEAKLEVAQRRRTTVEAKLAALHEEAARMLRGGGALPVGGDLAGKTIKEAALKVLAEHGGQNLHYRQVADEAMRRGFTSNSDAEVIRTSFRRMMHKNREVFQQAGEGRYTLANHSQ